MIRVQEKPFDVGAELKALRAGNRTIGGTCVFVGTVRDMSEGTGVDAMTLEHYPGMTQKALADIEQRALERWSLDAVLIVHRYGRMEPGEDIVLVIACSAHRGAAFEAARFLMDWLKTEAPFWKLEENGKGRTWVDARESDSEATARWSLAKPSEPVDGS